MMKDEWWRMNDEGWWFQAVEGFCRQTDGRTDICDCRVAFATEKMVWKINVSAGLVFRTFLTNITIVVL